MEFRVVKQEQLVKGTSGMVSHSTGAISHSTLSRALKESLEHLQELLECTDHDDAFWAVLISS